MRENEIDDLFRSNAEYLADQPHGDFNTEAFWNQLRPELVSKSSARRRIIGWRPWVAASLIALGGFVWWLSEDMALLPKQSVLADAISVKDKSTQEIHLAPKRIVGKELPNDPVFHTPNFPTPLAERKASQVHKESMQADTTSSIADALATVHPDQFVPVPDSMTSHLSENNAPAKPPHHIVHLNELRQKTQPRAQASTRMALRIGFGESGITSKEPQSSKPLSIPIQN